MMPFVDKNTEYILDALTASGFLAFVVGGAVRDSLLGRKVTDFDIATSALPEETKSVFCECPVIETGIKHGTVSVIIDGKPYEITTFRTETAYSDSRHPDSVSFVRDIESDLARRDFTVNAMAYSKSEGFVDPYGGALDLERKVIKTVGSPHERFREDSLRILRALRFASTLGFAIEAETESAVFELHETLSAVSRERVYEELKKLVCGANASKVITRYRVAIEKLLPQNGTPKLLDKLPCDTAMRFACVCGKGVGEALKKLRADNATVRMSTLFAESTPIPNDSLGLRIYASQLGREKAFVVAEYRKSLYGEDDKRLKSLLSSDTCLSVAELDIKGSDLSALGFVGDEIGKTLDKLLELVLRDELKNEKNELIAVCATLRHL